MTELNALATDCTLDLSIKELAGFDKKARELAQQSGVCIAC